MIEGGAVYEWVVTNSNWDETLLIVTTDHGNAFVLGDTSNQSIYSPVNMVARDHAGSEVLQRFAY